VYTPTLALPHQGGGEFVGHFHKIGAEQCQGRTKMACRKTLTSNSYKTYVKAGIVCKFAGVCYAKPS
jgi:hypothetical protein